MREVPSAGPPPAGPASKGRRGGTGAAPRPPPDPRTPDPRGGRPRAATPVAAPPLFQRLGFRLSSLFAVALLPLGLVSLVQANAWRGAARGLEASALMGDTLRAAQAEVGLIREAQGTAAELALEVPPLLADDAACDAVMARLVASVPRYSFVSFIPLDGIIRCAARDVSLDVSGYPQFREVTAARVPMIVVNAQSVVSGTSIVGLTHPVLDPDTGAYLGYIALSLPHSRLAAAAEQEAGPDARGPAGAPAPDGHAPDFVTFSGDGTPLTSSLGFERIGETLPEGRPLADLAQGGLQSFRARAAVGEERFYAVVPLAEGSLYALGSVPVRGGVSVGPVAVVAPLLTAGLMWAASLLVAWFAAERLVTRHILRLSHAIRSFASGSRVVDDLDMAHAPAEIRDAGDAFGRMTDAILHDEAEMEDVVHQKEVLLREVHHRVKNNLQLIASIMNMQMRRARSAETRALMQGLQDRIMSLATVHKELYQTTGVADVRADELLGDITRQIVGLASAPGRRFQVETDFAPLRLTPDQAVPLSLLLTEGLTNAIKHAAAVPGEATPRLRLVFAATEPGRAALSIENSAPEAAREGPAEGSAEGSVDGAPKVPADVAPAVAPAAGSAGAATSRGEGGLGGQLIAAFAAQLDGQARVEAAAGRYALVVDFALAPLEGGEERRVAPTMAVAV